ncbi:MAG: choice-of-anchor Q domain-containing protein, partial [Pseudomonadota bacterium]
NGGNITSGDVNQIFASVAGGAGVLADNGGPVQTIALASGVSNPALDIGTSPMGLTVDATGNARDVDQGGINNGGTVDAGAVELQTQILTPETQSLVVTTTTDVVDAFDNETSLREAIAFANDATAGDMADGDADNDGNANDTITFDASLAGQTIVLTTGSLLIGSDISIDGDILGSDNKADITISGNGNSTV